MARTSKPAEVVTTEAPVPSSTPIMDSLSVGTVEMVTDNTFVAVLVTEDADGNPTLALPGDDDAVRVLLYGALRVSKTDGLVLKFGNERRIANLTGDEDIAWVRQDVLKSHAATVTAEVKHVSKCQHTHDREVTGADVDWYFRVMKPGATSYSGICQPCAGNDKVACLAGGPTVSEGDVILGKTTRLLGSCHGKRAEVAAAAKRAAEIKKADKAIAEAARVAAAAEPVAEEAVAS